jgi:hypothetical protein
MGAFAQALVQVKIEFGIRSMIAIFSFLLQTNHLKEFHFSGTFAPLLIYLSEDPAGKTCEPTA